MGSWVGVGLRWGGGAGGGEGLCTCMIATMM